MNKFFLGKKLGMTQVFNENGNIVPVTVVETSPCTVVQLKTEETDGYVAVKVGYENVLERKLNKPEKGLFAKNKIAPKKFLKEFRVDSVENYQVGQDLKISEMFENGEKIDITGISKGKKLMVQCTTEELVQWEHVQHQEEYLKVKNYQDIWVTKKLQFKI